MDVLANFILIVFCKHVTFLLNCPDILPIQYLTLPQAAKRREVRFTASFMIALIADEKIASHAAQPGMRLQ